MIETRKESDKKGWMGKKKKKKSDTMKTGKERGIRETNKREEKANENEIVMRKYRKESSERRQERVKRVKSTCKKR